MNKFPATCGPDETLTEAEQKMQGADCAFLPVTAGAGSQRLVGMITDGGIRMAAQLRGRSPEELRVRDAMAKEVRVCSPGDGPQARNSCFPCRPEKTRKEEST